jgi:hypothetical protein
MDPKHEHITRHKQMCKDGEVMCLEYIGRNVMAEVQYTLRFFTEHNKIFKEVSW